MGSNVSASTSPSKYHFDPMSWTFIGEGQNYRILRNNSNGDELEEYLHTATDNREFDYLRSMFEYRLEKEYLVATKYFKQEDRNQMCSTFFQGFLYTERIPLRMNQIKDLPFPDIVHLVNSCLRGFRQLYLKAGGFNVNEHMIGINCDAKVKVWLSEDFGVDRPNDTVSDERVMVQQILEIIDKNIDKRTQPQSITQALTRNALPTFESALASLNQYTIRHVISIPPCLTSIAQLRDKGYFKKMLPKGRSIGSISLQPSINRSLPLITKSYMSSNDQILTASPQQIQINNRSQINILPSPQSIMANQLTFGGNYQTSQLPLVSPMSIATDNQKLLAQQNIKTDVQRLPLPAGIEGVPLNKINHLQYNGKQPLLSLTHKYPAPADYSPTQAPPPHIRGHRTQVRSWMSPPITRDGIIVQKSNRTNTQILPITPSFGSLNKLSSSSLSKPNPQSLQRTPSYPDYINMQHTPSKTSYLPDSLTMTKFQQTPKTTYSDYDIKYDTNYDTKYDTYKNTNYENNYDSYTSKFDTNKYNTFDTKYNNYDTYSSSTNYLTKSPSTPTVLPSIVIPNKIQLVVTKITNHQPEGTTTQNFILNPNESNVHHGLIKDIIQHTIALQDCMKQGAYYNPTISGQRTTQQIKFNDYKNKSRVSTTNFSQYSSHNRRQDGLTDPALLQHAMKGIASIIDSQKPSQFKPYQNSLNTFDSFNVGTSDNISNSFSPEDKSSQQILNIVSQALNTNNFSFPKNQQIQQIESVYYDSKYSR